MQQRNVNGSNIAQKDALHDWLLSAWHVKMLQETGRDLLNIQRVHENGIHADGEVRANAELSQQQQKSNNQPSRKILSGDNNNRDDDIFDDSRIWFRTSFGNTGRLIVSRKGEIVTMFCNPKDQHDECINKYTLVFDSIKSADDFMFSFLLKSGKMMKLPSPTEMKGYVGLRGVFKSPYDRTGTQMLFRRVIPEQNKRLAEVVNKIGNWWRSLTERRNSLSVSTSSSHDNNNIIRCHGRLERSQHIRVPSKKVKSKAVQKRRKEAAIVVQRAFRKYRISKEQGTACRKIQKVVREYLHRKRALRILHRFCRRIIESSRRRRAATFAILETREALFGRLTADVIEFHDATRAEMFQLFPWYEVVIEQLRELLVQICPMASIEPFGSSVTGLALPSSDLDLVIYIPPPPPLVIPLTHDPSIPLAITPPMGPVITPIAQKSFTEEMADIFAARLGVETDWVKSVRVVGSSAQPVVKLVCSPRAAPLFNFQIDLTFWHAKHTGIEVSRLFRDIVHRFQPQVGYLVLVIKQYLRELRLNSVFSGGLSSISLAIMVWVYCRENDDASLGELLLGFFSFFGEEGFFSKFAVSPRHGIVCLSYMEERQQDYHPPATIDDPIREGNNLAAGMFRSAEVSASFRHAFKVLNESSNPHPLTDLLKYRPLEAYSHPPYFE